MRHCWRLRIAAEKAADYRRARTFQRGKNRFYIAAFVRPADGKQVLPRSAKQAEIWDLHLTSLTCYDDICLRSQKMVVWAHIIAHMYQNPDRSSMEAMRIDLALSVEALFFFASNKPQQNHLALLACLV